MGAGRGGVRIARAVAALAVCAFDATMTVMMQRATATAATSPYVVARSRRRSISASRSASAAHVGGARVVVAVRLFRQGGHAGAAACMNSRSETHLIDTSRRADPMFPNLLTA